MNVSKSILCSLVLLLLMFSCRAQTFSEWFRQKKTQKKYLLQQIVKLQLYLEYAKKGYEIAGSGLATISRIKNGDFKLHEIFFTDLTRVNPVIRNYSKVKATITCITVIRDKADEVIALLSNTMFIESEQEFICRQVNNMLQQLLEDAILLNEVLTDNTLQMSDNERLKRIDRIYLSVSTKRKWMTWCATQCNLISMQRQRGRHEQDALQHLYLLK